eukprot:TRINITY_DN7233_c0_g1_i2.p1 TRINITY_DN7233_c0_g1~~TRINITY_DN7233_c0_g1_i2.p1  ORF type:complete len:366 (+),score=74.48 TRINITY_DN7233_c0_g1_i2:98-1195(+)
MPIRLKAWRPVSAAHRRLWFSVISVAFVFAWFQLAHVVHLPDAFDADAARRLSDAAPARVAPATATPGPLILFYAPVSSFLGQHMLKSPAGCPIACEFTEDRSRLHQAAGVVFHVPTHSGLPQQRAFPQQKWIVFSMESAGNYPQLGDEKFMKTFDWTMTYRLDSTIPCTYSGWNLERYMLPVYPKLDVNATAVFIASNCQPRNGRNEYVGEMMKHTNIHAYGRCHHNKDFPPFPDSVGPGTRKLNITRQYKFAITFDNHNEDHYVSEKFFQALVAGAVPVYMGAPNIDLFAPSVKSVIKATDFSGPKELAERLNYLATHDDEYQEYLSWKTHGPQESFKQLLELSKLDSRCRLCLKLAQEVVRT